MSVGTLCLGLETKLDLDAAAAENRAFMVTRSSERQEMVVLNDRLAVYIEKAKEEHSHRDTHTHTHLHIFSTIAHLITFLDT